MVYFERKTCWLSPSKLFQFFCFIQLLFMLVIILYKYENRALPLPAIEDDS